MTYIALAAPVTTTSSFNYAWILLPLTALAIICADVRWLRVAQREHYSPGTTARFAWRWWVSTPVNCILLVLAVLECIAAGHLLLGEIAPALVAAAGPVGLGLRGRTSRLAWTRRLTQVALVTVGLEALAIALAAAFGDLRWAVIVAGVCAITCPIVVDGALALLRPIEDVLAQRYVKRASLVLAEVHPTVVGITGSYGKTSTKNYVAHLLAGDRSVVASPRSFNNRAGLARTVNEHLAPRTDVLVAEMGAYGPGEISALCSWLRPELAVITSIGPAHLERFGSLERTLAAKAEITALARVVVLNSDDERLEQLAKALETSHKVVRASGTHSSADLAVLAHGDGLELFVAGKPLGVALLPESSIAPIRSNAACAAAVAIELGVSAEIVVRRLASLPEVPNRLQRHQAAAGYSVLDDTFNSNPAGARRALEVLKSEAPKGRRVLVTPGMVELGRTQNEENADLAECAAKIATDIVVVGRTNRAALVRGAKRCDRPPVMELVRTRDEAVEWARRRLGPGDAVLFENDLPDHFP
ncbi:MAG: UDP-N-acetylmuramoyl-tripeptide--D-alanyl-D-alanine ligase [Acidimicrobiales bacterium]